MFLFAALVLIVFVMWYADRSNKRDRKMDYDRLSESERTALLVLHSRQDLKTIAFLLAGIMVLLGVIADRV